MSKMEVNYEEKVAAVRRYQDHSVLEGKQFGTGYKNMRHSAARD